MTCGRTQLPSMGTCVFATKSYSATLHSSETFLPQLFGALPQLLFRNYSAIFRTYFVIVGNYSAIFRDYFAIFRKLTLESIPQNFYNQFA